MSLRSAHTIDVHAHVVLEETMGQAGAYGPELTSGEPPVFRVGDYRLHGVRYRGSPFMDVNLRFAAMDAAGIDYQFLSPNPLTYFHHIPSAEAQAFCRRHNDTLAQLVHANAERLGGLAALPMQDIGAAVAEAERAVTELGLHGVYIGTEFGHSLNEPALAPLFAKLSELKVPLFIHPAPAGIDGPAGDPNLSQFDLDIIVGFTAQETIAVATLIYGGVLDQFPDLDICVSHGGGATGYLFGRMVAAARKRPWASAELRAEGAFEERLNRLWFDVHLHADDSVALLKTCVNPDRLLFGTNFAGWDQHQGDMRSTAAPYTANAQRLFRVEDSSQ